MGKQANSGQKLEFWSPSTLGAAAAWESAMQKGGVSGEPKATRDYAKFCHVRCFPEKIINCFILQGFESEQLGEREAPSLHQNSETAVGTLKSNSFSEIITVGSGHFLITQQMTLFCGGRDCVPKIFLLLSPNQYEQLKFIQRAPPSQHCDLRDPPKRHILVFKAYFRLLSGPLSSEK